MFEAASEIVAKLVPVVQSVGCDVALIGVDGGVATVRLTRPYHIEADNTVRIQHFVERELREGLPGLTEVRFELPEPQAPFRKPDSVGISAVVPPETSDTCVLTLDRPISEESQMFASAAEASGNALVQRLFGVPHVDAVMIKDRMILVSRSGGTWPPIVEGLHDAIKAHFAGAPAPRADEQGIWNRVWTLLDEQINPAVASHGGHIELVEVRGTEVYLYMGGGCQGCSAAAVTLRQGVERAIRESVPEVTAIHDATDHDAGATPYYQ